MIILDTNVISEVMASTPSPVVMRRMDTMPTPEFATTAAASCGLATATRDVGGFADCGIGVVNPWDPATT